MSGWLLLWVGLTAFTLTLWGVLFARLARKVRQLSAQLRAVSSQPLDSPQSPRQM